MEANDQSSISRAPTSAATTGIFASRLTRTQQLLLVLFFGCIVGFGGITTMRSAYSQHRHTDADVYFRAAWAARAGDDIYRSTDDNGWHYHYPPLLATLLVPLADPPQSVSDSDRHDLVSYPVGIMIWYAIGVASIVLGSHVLATALEQAMVTGPSSKIVRLSQMWWALRVLPIVICLEPIGHSLGRGQVTPLIFLCIAAMTVALMRKNHTMSGLTLSAATCLKIFPAYLVLIPLLSRNWTALAWVIVGLALGLFVIPGLIVGFPESVNMLKEFSNVLSSELIQQQASVRSAELFNEPFGDLMSFRSILFKSVHLRLAERPSTVPESFTVLHIVISTVLTFTSLWAGRVLFLQHAAVPHPLTIPLLVGVLVIAIIPMIPTAQSHYFMLSIILAMALLASQWRTGEQPKNNWGWKILIVAFIVLSVIREIPGFGIMTDLGAPVWSGMLLWLAGITELRRIARADI